MTEYDLMDKMMPIMDELMTKVRSEFTFGKDEEKDRIYEEKRALFYEKLTTLETEYRKTEYFGF